MRTIVFLLIVMGMAMTLPAWAEDMLTVQPIPKSVKVDKEKAALGKMLYHDNILSADDTLSCATCHELKKGGTDRLPTSKGIRGQLGAVNSPTVYNSQGNFVQFWDGRAKDLAEQALGPVENPVEMGAQWVDIEKKVAAHAEYKKLFDKLYAGKVTKANIANAIAEFEKTLITPDSRFDLFLAGDQKAITALEKKGWDLFQEKGCITCHNGTYLGGNTYQLMSPDYFNDRGDIKDSDYGRFNVTKKEEDKHMFKVPMLRNVAVTAPYFHDGSVKTLPDAVKKMAKYQLGEELKPQEVNAITAFLKTLTGKYEGKPLDRM
jgi:cytochrome c peroxidase